MGRILLAWRILTSAAFAAKVTSLLAGAESASIIPSKPMVTAASVPPPKPFRSDAVTLLAALQREGRLIDFLMEPIDAYSDAQVGAAVRDIHRDCSGMLERQFAIRPVLDQAENSVVTIAANTKIGQIKLSGRVSDATHVSGTLVHHGWLVTKTDVPLWTGDADSASIIAAAEVEVR